MTEKFACECGAAGLSRRAILKGAVAGLAAGSLLPQFLAERCLGADPLILRVGSCMIGLKEAKEAGLDGVEVRVGDKPGEQLHIADPAVRQGYKDEMKETGLVISSLMMGLLNQYPLAGDPRAPGWLEQSIDAAKDLGAKTILVAFFNKGNLLDSDRQVKKADVEVVIERLKAAAPRAQQAGIRLGMENLLTAQQNLEILDRIGSDAVGSYYDVGNLTNMGYDVPAGIRLLKDRIFSFHFKDSKGASPSYLGEGNVKFEEIGAAIREIGYKGWIVLEAVNLKNRIADSRRNGTFIRRLFSMPSSG